MQASQVPENEGRVPDLPLTLPRLVMRRAAWVAVAGVLLWSVLGLARMAGDVDEELEGARALAGLFERLSSASAMPDPQRARRLLEPGPGDGATRHLQLRVTDGAGATLLLAEPEEQLPAPVQQVLAAVEAVFGDTPSFTVAWLQPRPLGDAWHVSLTARPQSERVEALIGLGADTLLLAGVVLAMLAAISWNTRRAFAPMARLLQAIGEMGDGEGRHPGVRRLPTMPVAELETIARALRNLDGDLATAQAQRRQLARQLQVLQEEERQRLAQELHDEFGQHLTALRANAAWLQRRLTHEGELAGVAREMAQQCEAIQQDVRAVLSRLRPPGTDDSPTLLSLGHMLEALQRAWPRGAADATRLDLDLRLADERGQRLDWARDAAALRLSPGTAMVLYRISQEAMSNVARHAQASAATLAVHARLSAGGQGVHIDWSVQDNGRGLSEPDSAMQRGSGLAGIKQRLWSLGAELMVEPLTPGTRLSAHVDPDTPEPAHA
jgi:two-component system, NarL family, sensor histidine kinase UhpB